MRSSSGRKKRFVENASRLELSARSVPAGPCLYSSLIYLWYEECMKNVPFLWPHNSVRPAQLQTKTVNSLIDEM